MFEYVIEIPQTQVNEPNWSQQLRVAAYCRVSTPSGLRAKKRPGYQQMLRDCRKGKIDLSLVKSLSRFGRDAKEAITQNISGRCCCKRRIHPIF